MTPGSKGRQFAVREDEAFLAAPLAQAVGEEVLVERVGDRDASLHLRDFSVG
jgi:hypothetical protein